MGAIGRVAVAISGGVDSAVAALLLKKKGFDVIGVFMKNWDAAEEGLCSLSQDRQDAEFVCKTLRIPFHEVDFVKEYWCNVFIYLLHDYETGFTPNPDIMCNRHIKFDVFFQHCLNVLKVDAIATGHYARTSVDIYQEKTIVDKVKLLTAKDSFKDQTMFLSRISQDSLQKTIFPLGPYFKSEVKKMAEDNLLQELTKKRESTGICFIGKRKFQEFISEYIPNKIGEMSDITNNKIVCFHKGLHTWTIGQCCHIKGYAQKYFVALKNVDHNSIYIVPGTNHPALFTRVLYAETPHWIADNPFNSCNVLDCEFRFQHTKPLIACTVTAVTYGVIVLLERPIKAITPGQFAVFYKNGECFGSSRISYPGPSLHALGHSVPANYREYEHQKIQPA